MPKFTKAEHAEALATLRRLIRPGDTVYTILRHVSRSGMSRDIGIVLHPKGKRGASGPCYPNWATAVFTGRPLGRDSVKVGGCGMDMGFALVYDLGSVLWPKGKIKPCSHCKAKGTRAVQTENPAWRAALDIQPAPDPYPSTWIYPVGPCPDCKGTGKERISGGYLIKHQWL